MIMKDLILTAAFFLLTMTGAFAQSSPSFKSIKIQVYPNPTTSFFRIDAKEAKVTTIYLYNLIGKRVKTFDPTKGSDYYVDELSSGLYLVQVIDNKGQIIATSRLTKR